MAVIAFYPFLQHHQVTGAGGLREAHYEYRAGLWGAMRGIYRSEGLAGFSKVCCLHDGDLPPPSCVSQR